MKRNFAAIILRGTGQVGGAAVAELLAIPECREVVMDRCAGAKKNCNDLNSAAVPLRVAAMTPEPPSSGTGLLRALLGSAHFAHCSAQILRQQSMKQMFPTLAPH